MKRILFMLCAVALCFSVTAQSEYCGVGTVWDAESQTCIVAENVELLDSNLDGVVGVEDLLNLLSHFGDEDMDFDGIYDSVDDCVGAYDECGVCNGPGPQILGIDTIIVYYDSLYAEAIDEWWVFEVDADTLLTYLCENPGCMNPTADNYDPYAIEEDNSCVWADGSPVCDFQNSFTFVGYTYDLVAIGSQCWFAENLRTEHYANGDAIPGELSNSAWSTTNSGAQAIYANSPANLDLYGRLYNWYAVDDSRGLCPAGWHVPSHGEWTELTEYLGGGSAAGSHMKSSASDTPPWDGSNSSGFSGLPGGLRQWGGSFASVGNFGYWWSSSPGSNGSMGRKLSSNLDNVTLFDFNPPYGVSVRCVRDAE